MAQPFESVETAKLKLRAAVDNSDAKIIETLQMIEEDGPLLDTLTARFGDASGPVEVSAYEAKLLGVVCGAVQMLQMRCEMAVMIEAEVPTDG